MAGYSACGKHEEEGGGEGKIWKTARKHEKHAGKRERKGNDRRIRRACLLAAVEREGSVGQKHSRMYVQLAN